MDESHRLKSMPDNYDVALFNQLYKDTKELRHKLAFEIDSRKFGVDYKEVLSWFDVKFIHTFNRYYGDERLKGYIINALKTYKLRIVKNSYQLKYSVHNSFDITEAYDLAMESEEEPASNLFNDVTNYFKKRLSHTAYLLWEIELNPPPYILSRYEGNKKIPKLPDELLGEYLGISQQELRALKSEIREVTSLAKKYFRMRSEKL